MVLCAAFNSPSLHWTINPPSLHWTINPPSLQWTSEASSCHLQVGRAQEPASSSGRHWGNPLDHSPSRHCSRTCVQTAARKSRPFQKLVTDEEAQTAQYLASLGESDWSEDLPGHRTGYVAIIGRPNAGKSTLTNALVGQKLSIVTSKAQTTRHRILSLVSEPDYQMIFLDTPGILSEERNKLDAKMMKNVRSAAREADALLAIVDASKEPMGAIDALNQVVSVAKEAGGAPLALVLNKIDLISDGEKQQLAGWFAKNSRAETVLPISARNGQGVEEVKAWAAQQLPEGPSLYPKDVVSEAPERFFIAEIVREQIFLQYQEEVPYSSTTEVVEYAERAEGEKDFVQVVVTVESDSQQGIIIGKGGAALKRLSTASRRGIEEFVGKPVYLDISVKVKKKWRADERSVATYGY